jgi:hypothetical protein
MQVAERHFLRFLFGSPFSSKSKISLPPGGVPVPAGISGSHILTQSKALLSGKLLKLGISGNAAASGNVWRISGRRPIATRAANSPDSKS